MYMRLPSFIILLKSIIVTQIKGKLKLGVLERKFTKLPGGGGFQGIRSIPVLKLV